MGSKNWFKINNEIGDRNVEDSKVGLDYFLDKSKNKTVIDLGCAEGLVSHWFLKECQCKSVHGYELEPHRVKSANIFFSGFEENKYNFESFDLNQTDVLNLPFKKYDIVIALAITQKLKDPFKFLNFVDVITKEYLAIRLPEKLEKEIDLRNKFKEKYSLEYFHPGIKGEPIGPLFIFKVK
jgi:2-polyprenyl-3-methyl-5-hydroxy-6-metoxy-1,4-benzoquinol methylase